MESTITLNANPLVRFLKKPQREFTRGDIIQYVEQNSIEMINFMYPAGDGRLKTLNFYINDLSYLETLLTLGERVDGSSLFSDINASSSDLYVLPRFATAFIDPFATIPTLCMLCAFFDKDGMPLTTSPSYTLKRACDEFTRATGYNFECMGELEYYVIAPLDNRFPATDQKGYHESAPFAKLNDFRAECMQYIARTGAQIKYGHSEVGNFVLGDRNFEQNEIEFLPVPAMEAADQLVIAKWIIRNLAHRRNLDVTFAPKITVGKAGSGLHVHMRIMDQEGHNMMVDDKGHLSREARRGIAGLMQLAPAITAFGNTNPTSYFRLVPHQEAPTNVCWGDRNRSVLVRVPLGWTAPMDMCGVLNPGTPALDLDASRKQTVEIRSADCSADVYMLMAALAVAMRHGFELGEEADRVAAETYVDVNIHNDENAGVLDRLSQLPVDCAQSADCLYRMRDIFEKHGVFSPSTIASTCNRLKAFDADEARQAQDNPVLMQRLVDRYFYCG